MQFQQVCPTASTSWFATQAIRGQSGLVMETANAKAAAEILEAKNRSEELEVSGDSGPIRFSQ